MQRVGRLRRSALALRAEVFMKPFVILGKPFAFVLSQCSTIPRNSRAAEMAAGLRTLGVLAEPFICQRADYQDAYAAGQGVTERDPNGKAAQEMRDLWQWANKRMKGKSA